MSQSKKEIASGVVFFLVAAGLYAGSYSIVVTKADAMGPQFFPRTVAVIMGILGILQAASGLKKTNVTEDKKSSGGLNMRSAATIGILFLYAFLVQKVGFIIMTAFYLLGQILLLLPKESLKSRKSILLTAVVSIAAPILIYQLFYRAFSIFLPAGILG